MPAPEPTFWDFVRVAFNRRPYVRGLGEVPWNKIALLTLAILGIGNPGFWLLGLGGELLYLYLMATNPRFQALVRAEKLQSERASAEDRVSGRLTELSEEGQRRFQALRSKCAEVQSITETIQAGALAPLDETRWRGLDELLWLFLRLQVSLEVLTRQLGRSDRRSLETEVVTLEQELAASPEAPERLKKSKASLLELKKKRLENLARAAEARQILEAELQRIEQQVELLREEAAISRSPEALSAKIDSITGNLDETNSWMRQHEDILSELSVDAVTELPRLLERPRQAHGGRS
jgi:DNA repair exonuclease SbcCD ATPase subunit